MKRSGAVVLACDFAAYQPGNFLATQLLIADEVRKRLALDCAFVLPERAANRPWLRDISNAGFQYELVPRSPGARVAALLRHARDRHARLLHSHFTRFDLDCLYVGRRVGAAVVWHLHNGLFGYPIKQRLTDVPKARVLGRACEAVVVCSEAVRRDALRRGFPDHKVELLPNALVLERFRAPFVERRLMRRDLGIDEDAFVILSFVWPPDRKGLDVVIEAVRRLNGRGGAVTALLVGPPELQRILVERLGSLPDWLAAIPPVADVASLFQAADVFVSAAREEGFSYAIGEAMASSLPVIGSDIPGTSHFWAAPGFLKYPTSDPDALLRRLEEIMRSSERESMGTGNRDWAFAHLDIATHVESTIELYERSIRSRHARST